MTDWSSLEVKPTFQGDSTPVAFTKWVAANLHYPAEVKDEGTVYVQFTISAAGKVCDVKVLRGVSETLDAEVVRAVSASPDWTPGQAGGKKVPVHFTMPVAFKRQ